MKLLVRHFIVVSILTLLIGCSQNETANSELLFPEEIPNFVLERDLDEIDWEKKAVNFIGNMIGNENRSGVIGADMPSLQVQNGCGTFGG